MDGLLSLGAVLWMLGGIFALILFVFAILFMKYANLWIRAFVSQAKINPLKLVLMPLMKINPHVIVDARIMAVQAGSPKHCGIHVGESAVQVSDGVTFGRL